MSQNPIQTNISLANPLRGEERIGLEDLAKLQEYRERVLSNPDLAEKERRDLDLFSADLGDGRIDGLSRASKDSYGSGDLTLAPYDRERAVSAFLEWRDQAQGIAD
jgi:hypothetical protein